MRTLHNTKIIFLIRLETQSQSQSKSQKISLKSFKSQIPYSCKIPSQAQLIHLILLLKITLVISRTLTKHTFILTVSLITRHMHGELKDLLPFIPLRMKDQIKLILNQIQIIPQMFQMTNRLLKQRVDRDPQSIFNHTRYNPGQMRRSQLKARIRIDLQKPGLQISINQKIVSKDLKAVHSFIRVKLRTGGLNRVRDYFPHLSQNLLLKVHLFGVVQLQVSFKVSK